MICDYGNVHFACVDVLRSDLSRLN